MRIATVVAVGALALAPVSAAQRTPTGALHRVVFTRLGPVRSQLFVAGADGSGERPLLPATGLDYSPSLSPDGRWVVFTSERDGSSDIYRVHPDGTGIERLTDDPAYEDQAVLSPDGKSLAFVSTRVTGRAHVWVMDLASHRAKDLTDNPGSEFRPAWSPDGQWIAFTSDRELAPTNRPGSWELVHTACLYVMRADGSGLRRLTTTEDFAGSPRWSADGTHIIYYEATTVGTWYVQRATPAQGTTRLISIEVATGHRLSLTSGDGTRLWPQFLPDGSIGYLVKYPTNGNETEIQIARGGTVTAKSPRGALRNPSWSADGKMLVYARVLPASEGTLTVPAFSRESDFALTRNVTTWFQAFSPQGDKLAVALEGGARLEVMNADGSDRHTLVDRKAGLMMLSPAWSPDGRQIAFSAGRYFRSREYPSAGVSIIGVDGTGLRAIADDEANNGFPSWSPDGKRIVYKKDQHLVIVTLADNSVTTLTAAGAQHDNFPEWSPKGNVIMFTSDRDRAGDYRLYTIKPDGTGLRMIPNSVSGDGHSVWSPDGEWLLFSSARMGFKDERPLAEAIPQPYGELFMMRPDGTGLRQLTDNQWEDALPSWLPEHRAASGPSARR